MSGLGLVWDYVLERAPSAAPGSLISLCYQVLEKLKAGRSQRVAPVAGFELSWFSWLLWAGVGVSKPQVVTRSHLKMSFGSSLGSIREK